jgi:hypothetical protein
MNRSKFFILTALVALSSSSVALAGRDDAGDRAIDRAVEEQVTQDVGTEPTREIASDFTNDYLDSIADEQANDATIAQKDSKEHDQFLNSLKGNR